MVKVKKKVCRNHKKKLITHHLDTPSMEVASLINFDSVLLEFISVMMKAAKKKKKKDIVHTVYTRV